MAVPRAVATIVATMATMMLLSIGPVMSGRLQTST